MVTRNAIRVCISLIFFSLSSAHAQVETSLVVRAKAKDAKFIGTSVGSALVIIKDVYTSEILAKGFTEGSTGNTGLIMKTPITRNMPLADDRTAKFETQLMLSKPTLLEIEVHSPYTKRQATVKASKQLWVLPGKHLDGDGVVIEIPGFIVDVLHPTTHKYMKLDDVRSAPMELRANVVMMCGCIITPGGLWDGNQMEVDAMIHRNGEFLETVKLKNVEMNIFQSFYTFNQSGTYEIIVTAFDPASNNTGVDRVNFVISE